MTTPTFAHIPLAHITASLTNPRKTFDAAKLAELTESIRASGVHQPILLRPLPGDRVAETDRAVQYEIVAGERRHRACQAAGLDTIPAMIRPLTDAQVLEIQIIENLQRDDLLELEEAEGYEALMRHSLLNADQVGEKIGKSRSYVYARLKLLDLCPEARTALRQRTIPASVALLVARIPDHKLQIKALGEIVNNQSSYYGGREPMSHRAASRLVQENYMLRLADARFPITAMDLLPQAGSCSTCPKRTGADPDLFADVKSADTCIDPACYHAKEEAHAAAQVQAAQAKGQPVIAGKEAAEIALSNYAGTRFKGYKRLDNAEDSPTNTPLRKIIGPIMKAEGIQPTLIAHPRNAGEMVECLPNEVVSRLLKAVEGQAAAAKTVTKEVKALVDEKKAKAQAKAQHQYEQGWRDTLLEDTWYALRDDADANGWSTDVHRFLALRAANRLHQDDAAKLAKLLNLGQVAPQAAMIDLVKTSPMPGRLHLLILMQEASSASDPDYTGHPANEALMLIAQAVWQDRLDTIIQEIKAEIHATVWPPADDAAGKNTSTPNAPAAQASRGAGEGAKKGTKPAGKKTARPAAPAAATVGEEEARQGIAAAMQSVEGGPPVADAQATPQPAGALTIGDKVKILPTATGKREARWVGKVGTVQGRVGPEAWDVSFTAKVARPITGKSIGHFQSFHVTELEVCHD